MDMASIISIREIYETCFRPFSDGEVVFLCEAPIPYAEIYGFGVETFIHELSVDFSAVFFYVECSVCRLM